MHVPVLKLAGLPLYWPFFSTTPNIIFYGIFCEKNGFNLNVNILMDMYMDILPSFSRLFRNINHTLNVNDLILLQTQNKIGHRMKPWLVFQCVCCLCLCVGALCSFPIKILFTFSRGHPMHLFMNLMNRKKLLQRIN